MTTYTIMKNGKYVKDYTQGEKLTTNYYHAEKFTTRKAADQAAVEYGAGYEVVLMQYSI